MAIDCITMGAEDFIPKPFNTTLLESRITSILEKKTLRDEIRQSHDRMEQELEGARARQTAILPTPLFREGVFAAFGRMRPARAIGGDFYDSFLRDEHTLYLAIGDVAGKGPEAALFMTQVVQLVRMIAKRWSINGEGPSPAQIVRIINEDVALPGELMQFVTLHLCQIDLRTGQARFCDAGHGLVWRLRGDGAVEPIELIGGPPIGVAKDANFDEGEYVLTKGDAVFFATDGITEATNAAGKMFGEDRLCDILGTLETTAPEQVVDRVFDAVTEFLDEEEAQDDVTALAFRLFS